MINKKKLGTLVAKSLFLCCLVSVQAKAEYYVAYAAEGVYACSSCSSCNHKRKPIKHKHIYHKHHRQYPPQRSGYSIEVYYPVPVYVAGYNVIMVSCGSGCCPKVKHCGGYEVRESYYDAFPEALEDYDYYDRRTADDDGGDLQINY